MAHLRRYAIAVLAAIFVGAPASARPGAGPADLTGWDATRWGMTEPELSLALGTRLRPLGGRLVYGTGFATHGVAEVRIGDVGFRTILQMWGNPPGLSQVLLEPDGKGQPERHLRALHDALRDMLGPPSTACATPRADGGPLTVEILWRFPTTTVHLTLLDFRTQAIAKDDPNRDPDPLTPYYRTRRNNERFLPRRLLVRYHATARTDLLTDCRPPAG